MVELTVPLTESPLTQIPPRAASLMATSERAISTILYGKQWKGAYIDNAVSNVYDIAQYIPGAVSVVLKSVQEAGLVEFWRAVAKIRSRRVKA